MENKVYIFLEQMGTTVRINYSQPLTSSKRVLIDMILNKKKKKKPDSRGREMESSLTTLVQSLGPT